MEHKIKNLLDHYQVDPSASTWSRLETKLMADNKTTSVKNLPLKEGFSLRSFSKVAAVLVLTIVSLYSIKQITSDNEGDLSATDNIYYSSNIKSIQAEESTDDIFEVKNLRLLKEAYNKH